MRRALLSLATLAALAGFAHAQRGLPAGLRDVGFDQCLGAQVPPELTFRD